MDGGKYVKLNRAEVIKYLLANLLSLKDIQLVESFFVITIPRYLPKKKLLTGFVARVVVN